MWFWCLACRTLSQLPELIVGCQLRHFSARQTHFNGLLHETEFFHNPGINPVLSQFISEMANAGHEGAIFECSLSVAAPEPSAVSAMQHVDNTGAGDGTEHSALQTGCRTVLTGMQFDEIDLQPGSRVEAHFEDHGLTNQRIEGMRADVAHASGAGVGESVLRISRKETVVIAPGLEETSAVYLPAPVAVRSVIQVNLVGFLVVIQA